MEHIKSIAKELQDKEVHYSKLSWVQYTTGIDFGVDEGYKAMTAILENKTYFEQIDTAMKGSHKSKEDQRRLALIHKVFKPYHESDEVNALAEKINQKTTELSQILNTHRTVFEGKEISAVELAQILAKDDNRERRRQAFFAKNQVNEKLIAAGFLDLVNMRKTLAELSGKSSFVALKLEEDELDPTVFDNWKNEVKAILPEMKAIRQKYAEKFLTPSGDEPLMVMPWDEAYISAQLAPALNAKVDMSQFYTVLAEFFNRFGIDIRTMNITYDVFPRANKSEWGYNFPIETGVDSRILANVKDLYNEYNVLLHETGHGVHSFLTDPEDIMMNYGISGIISEGIANLFGGFLTDELFYKDFFKPEEVAEAFADIKQWQQVNAFRAIHRILMDQAFYLRDLKDGADVEALYWELYEDLFEESPFGENPPWAFLIHHTTHPIYLHNYFMGDVTCAMLKEVFNATHGTKSVTEKPEVFGQFLMDQVIAPAGRMPYPELFQNICGKPFSLSFLKSN